MTGTRTKKKNHLENVFVSMANSLQKSVSFFSLDGLYRKKIFFQNVSPWLKTFSSLKQTPFLLSIYSFGFSVKASKFLSLFFGVNKVVTFFQVFPVRVKKWNTLFLVNLEYSMEITQNLSGKSLYQKRKRIWWKCLFSLFIKDIVMKAVIEMLSICKGQCNRTLYF